MCKWGRSCVPMKDLGRSELIGLGAIEKEDLQQSLDALVTWLDAQKAYRQRQIIEHMVSEDLAGRAHLIKAYSLAIDVFAKGDDFDPSKSSLVRVEMHRLRESLSRFYREGAQGAPYALVLPPGQYRLMAVLNTQSQPADPPDAATPSPGDGRDTTVHAAEQQQALARAIPPVDGDAAKASRRLPGNIHPAVLALLLIAATVGLAVWLTRGQPVGRASVERLSPTVAITLDETDVRAGELTQIKQLIGDLNPIRFPIVISLDQDTDYILNLASFVTASGDGKLRASLYDNDRDLVATSTYSVPDFSDSDARFKLGKRINDHFMTLDGFVTADFPRNPAYPQARRELYSCYRQVNRWNMGRLPAPLDFDRTLDCLDPDQVKEPRDKVLLYVMRSSIIGNVVAGTVKTETPYTVEDARAELEGAAAAYPDEQLILGQRIVTEWRDAKRDPRRLRRLLEQAERGVMSVELRYNVATSYAFFLDDWDKARETANEEVADVQGTRLVMETFFNYVPIPEAFVSGDYDTAEAALERTGAVTHPGYALLKLAIACGRGDRQAIEAAAVLVDKHPALTRPTIIEYARNRNYGPVLQRALLTALARPECKSATIARQGKRVEDA